MSVNSRRHLYNLIEGHQKNYLQAKLITQTVCVQSTYQYWKHPRSSGQATAYDVKRHLEFQYMWLEKILSIVYHIQYFKNISTEWILKALGQEKIVSETSRQKRPSNTWNPHGILISIPCILCSIQILSHIYSLTQSTSDFLVPAVSEEQPFSFGYEVPRHITAAMLV